MRPNKELLLQGKRYSLVPDFVWSAVRVGTYGRHYSG